MLQGSRWRVKNLTYKVTKYPRKSGLTKSEVDRTLRKAFNVWEKATGLKFSEKDNGKVHIEIRFEGIESDFSIMTSYQFNHFHKEFKIGP